MSKRGLFALFHFSVSKVTPHKQSRTTLAADNLDEITVEEVIVEVAPPDPQHKGNLSANVQTHLDARGESPCPLVQPEDSPVKEVKKIDICDIRPLA